MNDEIRNEVTQRLITDYGFKKFGNWLRNGTCPNCGQKELLTSAAVPSFIQCSRMNKCGYEIRASAMYPDVFLGSHAAQTHAAGICP